MSSNPDILKELLLEDYRYRAEAMKNSEQAGETRLNLFIGLSTFILGGLGALSTQEFAPKGDDLKPIFLAAFFAMLVVGSLTLLRLLIRNDRTDECKRDLDHIRQTFVTLFDQDELLIDYYPVGFPDNNSGSSLTAKLQLRKFGGLSHMMAAINSFLIAGLVACTIWPFNSGSSFGPPRTWVALVLSIAAFIIALTRQNAYIKYREVRSKSENLVHSKYTPSHKITHAGGVVYRSLDNEIKYLIISPQKSDCEEWVLPKGHIETPLEAALREVKEETAAVTEMVCPLDTVEFITPSESVHAKFYLLKWLCDEPSEGYSIEGRTLQWLPYKEALEKLTYPESQHLLKLAENKRKALLSSQPESQSRIN
jgi:ADP-ribose pyrophosphatase YjhB (NUDIX family)